MDLHLRGKTVVVTGGSRGIGVACAAGFAAEGTAAFGSASLAFLRFTRGGANAAMMIAASLLFWMIAPALLAVRRLNRADL